MKYIYKYIYREREREREREKEREEKGLQLLNKNPMNKSINFYFFKLCEKIAEK